MRLPFRKAYLPVFYNYLLGDLEFESVKQIENNLGINPEPLLTAYSTITVLDVGAGQGYFLDWADEFFDVTAIDLHPSRPRVQKMNALKMSFSDNSFDLVFCSNLIEHLDCFKLMNELCRVSKNYVCVITDPQYPGFWDDPKHIRPYTPNSIKELFGLNHFKTIKVFKLPFYHTFAVIGKKVKKHD